MKQKKSNRIVLIFLALILILALGLRFRVFSKQINNMSLSNDPRNYWEMSHRMVDEGIYRYSYDKSTNEPNARVTPGYPLFLAAVYKVLGDKYLQITVVRILQIIMSTVSVLLGFLIVKKAFKTDLAALLTAFFMAIYPTYAMSPVMLLTETMALFTMLLYFYLMLFAFESGNKLINLITGIAFGVHVLVRPALLPLFIFPFIFCILSSRTSKKAFEEHALAQSYFNRRYSDKRQRTNNRRPYLGALASMFVFQLIGLIIVMAPWWIRNVAVLGEFTLTAKGTGNPFLAGTYPYFQEYFLDVSEEIKNSNDLQMAHGIQRLIEGLKTDPVLYIKWYTLGKTEYIFNQPYLSRLLMNSQTPSIVIHFSVLIPGILGVILHAIKGMKSFWFYFYGLTILGLQLMFVPDPRFAYLIMFFIIVGAAYLISSIIKAMGTKKGIQGDVSPVP